jgi:hypothetical protein
MKNGFETQQIVGNVAASFVVGAATRPTTFYISVTYAITIFVPMHTYFNDFIF